MRVAREIRAGSPNRVSPFAHERLGEYQPIPVTRLQSAYYLRFRVQDRPGIIARLAGVLAGKGISLDAVLQTPAENSHDLPFVITIGGGYSEPIELTAEAHANTFRVAREEFE